MVVEGARTGTDIGRCGGGACGGWLPLPSIVAGAALRERAGRFRNRLAGDFRRRRARQFRHRLAIRSDNLHQEQEPNRVLLKASHHAFKHVEGFFLVGHQRILLAIAAQTDAFLEVVHAQQMVFPQAVEHAEHDHAFMQPHGGAAQDGFLHFVLFFQPVKDRFPQLVAVQRIDVDAFLLEIDAELRSELRLSVRSRPIGRDAWLPEHAGP